MKLARWLLATIVILTATAALGSYLYLRATIPRYDGTITVQGIAAPIDVVRDSFGVPHIFAANPADAYFALGYCMAQDRLVQMEVMRLLAQGRLSEMMGEATVETDRLHRTIVSAYHLERGMDASSPEALLSVDSFLEGINYYIAHPQGPRPLEFLLLGHTPQPFDRRDFASLGPLYTMMLDQAFESELLKAAVIGRVGDEMAQDLFVDHNDGFPTTIPEGESIFPGFEQAAPSPPADASSDGALESSTAASALLATLDEVRRPLEALGVRPVGSACNSLVISADKTGTGKPLLAQDYHFPYTIPSALYEAHLSTPDFKVAGYIFTGLPYVLGGQNEHMAWVFTAGLGDEMDFYLEKLHPEDPNKYLYEGEYEEMEVRKEIIEVKGGEDVEIEVRLTRHGPVVDDLVGDLLEPGSSNTALSLRMTGPDFLTDHEALYLMNTSRNADEFLAGVKLFKSPGQHWVYADREGDIGYIYGGAIPVRKGFDGTIPQPGWTGKQEWAGYVAPERQPQVRNPKMGFINTSNAKPATDSYPHPQGDDYSLPDRLARVREVISETIAEKGAFSAEDVDRVFTDAFILMARDWTPLLLSALEDESLSAIESKAMGALAQWNYTSKKDSVAAMVFQATLVRIIENAFSRRLGEDLYGRYIGTFALLKGLRRVMRHEESPWFDDPETPAVEGRRELLVKSFKEAAARMEREMGAKVDSWALGRRLTLTLKHPLSRKLPLAASLMNVGPLPMDGGPGAPLATYYDVAKPYEIVAGTQARIVVDFSDRKNCRIVNMPGISGNFMSPHYSDQVQTWYEFESRPLALYREEVDEDARYLMKMLPE